MLSTKFDLTVPVLNVFKQMRNANLVLIAENIAKRLDANTPRHCAGESAMSCEAICQ